MATVKTDLGKVVGDGTVSYSTEEKIIGTWIDGKPVYRKILTGTVTSTGDVLTTEGFYERIVSSHGEFVSGTTRMLIPRIYGSNDFIDVAIASNNINLWSSADKRGFVYTIIIEYTKTTDTAPTA